MNDFISGVVRQNLESGDGPWAIWVGWTLRLRVAVVRSEGPLPDDTGRKHDFPSPRKSDGVPEELPRCSSVGGQFARVKLVERLLETYSGPFRWNGPKIIIEGLT